VPGVLIEGWRDWALTGMAGVRTGGDAARDAFLTSPLWRFAVPAGVFGAGGGVGVMGPGADATGRLFPVLVAAAAPVGDPDAALASAAPWCARVEARLLSAFDPDYDLAGFGAGLGAPGLDAAPPAREDPSTPGVLTAHVPEPRRVTCAGPADAALFEALFGLRPPAATQEGSSR
jgi:type VI secretion system ImpM family protein